MRTEHLEYLVSLKETESFSKTSEIFLTSHQVISKAISNLEDELNIQILERTHRGVRFTTFGLIVYKYAEEILRNQSQLLQEISAASKIKGKLQIYIAPRFANDFFIDFYNDFQKNNSQLQIVLKNVSFDYIFEHIMVDENTVILLPIAQSMFTDTQKKKIADKNLTYEVILSEPLGYCVSRKSKHYAEVSKFIQGVAISVDSHPFPIVTYNYYTSENMEQLHNFYLVDNFDMQKKMIKRGSHVAFMTPFEYSYFFKNDPQVAFIQNQEVKANFCYMALYLEHQVSESVHHFLNELKNFLKQS